MPLYWKCECGEQFEERGREEPGNRQGWLDAIAHVKMHKKNKEPERLVGLIDTDTGEVIFEGGMRPVAVKQGILPYGPSSDGESSGNKNINPFQGRILVRDIPIDPGVIICFYEARARWPQEYPDDTPKTISKFITECVFGLFTLCADELTFGRIVAASWQALSQQAQNASEDELTEVGLEGEEV